MTPLSLELAGFACFHDTTRIDFSNLGLFAISGPTGSGKTTLLDALTYALYGQTARLGKQGLDSLISPGKQQLLVQFEFKANKTVYRVTRTADRKPSGKVDRHTRIEQLTQAANWSQLQESEKLKEADKKIEAIVGLDYDGFTRAVLLPQGAFDEFLKGDAGKRRKLLTKLLSLDKVEGLQKEAGRLAKEADLMAQGLQVRLQQDYADVTPEKLKELKQCLKDLEQQKQKVRGRAEALEKVLKELENLKDLIGEKSKLDSDLLSLKAKDADIVRMRSAVTLANRARLIEPHIRQLESQRAKLKRFDSEVDTAHLRLAELQKDFTSVQAEYEQILKHKEQRIPNIEEQLRSLAAVSPLLAQLEARGGSLALAKDSQQTHVYSEKAWDDLQGLSVKVPNLQTLAVALKEGKQQEEELKKNLQSFVDREVSLKDGLDKHIARGKEARRVEEQARLALDTASIKDRALALREHLQANGPCPVCEQNVEHLPATEASQLPRFQAAYQQAQAEIQKIETDYRTLKGELDTVQARMLDVKETLERTKQANIKRVGQYQECLAEFESLAFDDPVNIPKVIDIHKHLLLASLAAQIVEKTQAEDPHKARENLENEKQELASKFQETQVRFQNKKESLAQLTTQVDMLERQVKEVRSDFDKSKEVVEEALEKAKFSSQKALQDALLDPLDIQSLEGEIGNFQTQKESLERREVQLQAQLAGKSFDEPAYLEQKEELTNLKASLEDLQTRCGRIEGEIEHIQSGLEKAKDLRKELAEANKTYEIYRQLSLDFRGNEFQEYLLSQVQAKLAKRASYIIRDITDGRYDLRLVEGDYLVQDAWHTAEIRQAKTLSGGETFIASLALALALSDTIAGRHALGALFLDEGFGTLDSSTLEAVAKTLEVLTSEGRMVGVITHVKSLTERLPVRLQIKKGPEGSSVSWDL